MEILVPQKFRIILYSIGVLYDKFCELFMKITKLKTPIKYTAYVRIYTQELSIKNLPLKKLKSKLPPSRIATVHVKDMGMSVFGTNFISNS